MEELRHLKDTSENIANELSNLQDKFDKKLYEIYEDLTPFQKLKYVDIKIDQNLT